MPKKMNLKIALRGPVPFSHLLLKNFISEGDLVVDATCGNGNDTVILAELVGNAGKVWGFDIQADAIHSTSKKLLDNGFNDRVKLFCTGHENISAHCPEGLSVVLFNLGYLPGANHTIMTTGATTISACSQSLRLLKRGGVLIVTIYPGHTGGGNEGELLTSFASDLPQKDFHVWELRQKNVAPTAPFTLFIQKAY